MMSFKKALLASAIAAVSASAFAMEAMDDSSLSDASGQAGLTITLNTKLNISNLYLHDTDGFTGQTDSGALVISGIAVDNGAGGNAGISIAVDAGAANATSTSPILQVAVSTTTTTKFVLGTLAVANSNRTTTGGSWGVVAGSTTGTLMNLGSVTIGATANLLNIQMGNESQGAWMKANAVLTGGLAISGFSLSDLGGAVSGGGIGFDLTATDTAGGANLTTGVSIDANTSGLQITVNQLGTAAGGMDVRMANLRLGNLNTSAPVVGDVEIVGLNLAGSTIQVTGH